MNSVAPWAWYALASSLSFAAASMIFTHFSKAKSVLWMNSFKAMVALVCFGIAVFGFGGVARLPEFRAMVWFLVSGFIALNIGDLFMLRAYSAMGPARTLIVYSFQPLFVGGFAYLALSQPISSVRFLAILLMIGCVVTLSYERLKREGRWDWTGPLLALTGAVLDATGILLTRFGFEADPNVAPLEGNFYRCLGAVLGFAVIGLFKPLNLSAHFKSSSKNEKILVLVASTMGTFAGLWLYLIAIRTGHLASVTAIQASCPIWAALFESLWSRRWPSRYFFISVVFMALGLWILLRP